MTSERESDKKSKLLKIETFQRHILFCGGPSCCAEEQGEELWNHLKKRLIELSLVAPGGEGKVFRTKTKCLRVCADGPIALVYPEGIWYRLIDRASLDKIIEEHLLHGRVVEDLKWLKNESMSCAFSASSADRS